MSQSQLMDRLIEATMALVAERGWQATSYTDILQAAGLVYRDVYQVARDKQAVMQAFADRMDASMLREAEAFDPQTPVRELLFDLLMARFDALSDYRPALARMVEEQQRAPLDALATVLRLERSMALVLEAAGETSTGLVGQLRAKALTALYLRCLKAWLQDESEDLGPTMKTLDESLAQAERAADFIAKGPKGFRWPRGTQDAAAGDDDAEPDQHSRPEEAL